MEGLIASQFHGDSTLIQASLGSPFNMALIEDGECVMGSPCFGTAEEWVDITFGGWFKYENVWRADLPYLIGLCFFSRVICYAALTKLNYLRK